MMRQQELSNSNEEKVLSLKKLEDERQNLVRVNDILSELEKQVGPLEERQSEKAREYLKRKEELKTYDINMFLLEMERIRDQIRGLEEKLRITKGSLKKQPDNMRIRRRNMRRLKNRWK